MLETFLRPTCQKYFFDPIARKCHRYGLYANQLTGISFFSGISVAAWLAMGWIKTGLVLLLISGLFDVLDGTLARIQQSPGLRGTVYDIVSDRMVEFSVILGLFLMAPQERGLLCVLMLGSVLVCVSSFLVVGIVSDKKSEKTFYYSPGLIERGEALLLKGLMIYFSHYFVPLSILFIALVLLTSFVRVLQFTLQETQQC